MSLEVTVAGAHGPLTMKVTLDSIGATYDGLHHANTKKIIAEYTTEMTTALLNAAAAAGAAGANSSEVGGAKKRRLEGTSAQDNQRQSNSVGMTAALAAPTTRAEVNIKPEPKEESIVLPTPDPRPYALNTTNLFPCAPKAYSRFAHGGRDTFDLPTTGRSFATVPSERSYTIFIKSLTGAMDSYHLVRASYTFDNVKYLYQERWGIPPDQQRIIWAGRQMEDGRTLADFKVPENATLHMVLQLRGT